MVIGEIILSAFLPALFGRLLKIKSFAINLDKEVDSLKGTLHTIHVVLDNAERRQNEDCIRKWLQDLREAAYEANDLLDDVVYESLRRRHVKYPKVRNSRISIMSMNRFFFDRATSERIINIRERLANIIDRSSVLNLRETPGSSGLIGKTASETSSVGDDIVFGRNQDVKTILWLLLSNDFSEDNVDFIGICGKAGIGKTTLVQVVYKDVSLVGHFDIKMWVHASSQDDNDDTNVKALIKATIESIKGKSCNLPDLDTMQDQLRQLLEHKRYLLVLDAMLNDRSGFLDALKNVLMSVGANGSKVLVTTPKRSISKLMNTVYTHELQPLSRDDSLEVIKKYASCAQNPSSHQLHRIIEKIVDKCNGLPLAAKKYGMLLMAETEIERWELISRKEVGEVLELDFDVSQTLPSNMKRCFAYCSIFPPNFTFHKDQLVQQWLAQDLVPTEELGREYFDQMFCWSLFRYSDFDYTTAQQTYVMLAEPFGLSVKKKQTYVMDEDIRCRAQSIAGEECFVMYHDNSHKISEMARHVSFICHPSESRDFSLPNFRDQISATFEHLLKAKGLYTLILLARMQVADNLLLKKVPDNLTKLQCLRSLDLSNTDVHELPNSISNLKHLRYLALCNTKVERLPNSLSKLYHLQSLQLRNCYKLIELPKDMRCLTNLRHLDLHLDDDSMNRGALKSMPLEVGKLTRLQTLPRFVVSKNNRCGVSELTNMNDLQGSLLILNLELIDSGEEARMANLEGKEHLKMLELRWGEDMLSSNMDVTVLDHLRPHANIRELKIGGYREYSLSSWIGDPSFSNLVTMMIYNCRNLIKLPPLGQLSSLKKLHIESLPTWSEWCEQEDCLPSLRELVIRDCTNLRQLCPTLPALMELEIDRCRNLAGLPRFSSLHSLKVKDSGDWIWGSLHCLNSLSFLCLSGLTSTTGMELLSSCTNLWKLEINNCKELNYLPDDCLPVKLAFLKIEDCPGLQALPSGLMYLRSMHKLQVQSCEGLLSLPMGMKQLVSLKNLELSSCPNLSSMPTDGLPTGLQILSINKCPNLMNWFQQEEWGIISRIQSVWINDDLIVSSETSNSGASTSQGRHNH